MQTDIAGYQKLGDGCDKATVYSDNKTKAESYVDSPGTNNLCTILAKLNLRFIFFVKENKPICERHSWLKKWWGP